MRTILQWMVAMYLLCCPLSAHASQAGVFAPVAGIITSGVALSYIIGTLFIIVLALWAILKFINRDLGMGEGIMGMVSAAAAGIFFFVIIPGLVTPGVALGATLR
jgi:hypothetical protein